LCDFRVAPFDAKMSFATLGKVDTSPVYSTSSVGCSIDGADHPPYDLSGDTLSARSIPQQIDKMRMIPVLPVAVAVREA
jgi:hypothetical protein